jgi:putative PIN family toxin of toxin-antitoxin system
MADPRRGVFDTGFVLQATLSPGGPAGQVFRFLDAGTIEVYVSPRLRSEYEDVLSRPAIREKNSQLTDERMRAVLDWFDEKAILHPNPPQYVQFQRDPDDEAIPNLAIHVGADYIVARDRDLLDLDSDINFRQRFPRLRIVDPVTFLRELLPE